MGEKCIFVHTLEIMATCRSLILTRFMHFLCKFFFTCIHLGVKVWIFRRSVAGTGACSFSGAVLRWHRLMDMADSSLNWSSGPIW